MERGGDGEEESIPLVPNLPLHPCKKCLYTKCYINLTGKYFAARNKLNTTYHQGVS